MNNNEITHLGKDVQIKLAAVSIQAIRIDGKQMTLSIYNQIPYRQIIYLFRSKGSTEVLLRGTPWGTVNICRCKYEKGLHSHLIWECNGNLFKCRVTDERGLGRSDLFTKYEILTDEDVTEFSLKKYYDHEYKHDIRKGVLKGLSILATVPQLYIAA